MESYILVCFSICQTSRNSGQFVRINNFLRYTINAKLNMINCIVYCCTCIDNILGLIFHIRSIKRYALLIRYIAIQFR